MEFAENNLAIVLIDDGEVGELRRMAAVQRVHNPPTYSRRSRSRLGANTDIASPTGPVTQARPSMTRVVASRSARNRPWCLCQGLRIEKRLSL